MGVGDVLRSHTLSVRDRLSGLEKQIAGIEAVRNAADDRVKRATTEITRQRTLEAERKRAVGVAAEKLAEAQRTLEELERKRQEALEVLVRIQEEHNAVERSRRDAQVGTEAALGAIRKEQKAKEEADAELIRVKRERAENERLLRCALLKGLEVHLEQQVATMQSAFSTQEQWSKAMREFEAFRKARHTDAEIGRLCDERDEIRRLLGSAMVPGVKTMLQSSLVKIEEAIAKRFPVAFQVPDIARKDNPIEELLFYCDREGKTIFLLPISSADWIALGEVGPTERTSKSICLVWSFIRGLGLRTEDGDFKMVKGRPVFASKLDLEMVASQSFSLSCEEAEVIRYVLAAVPTELQEALSYEDQND